MKTNNRKPVNQFEIMALVVFSGKVLQETKDQWKEAMDNSGAETFNQFLEMVLEAYLNPKTKEIEVPTPTSAQQEALQLKDNEIGRLKIQIDQLEEKAGQLKTNLDNQIIATQELDELNMELKAKGGGIQIQENQLLIDVPPVVAAFLDKEAETATRKTGKQWTRQDVLLQNFWTSIDKGVTYPFTVYSASEINKVAKQVKEAQEAHE